MRNLSILEKKIDVLGLDDSVTKKIKDIDIKLVKDLWQCKLVFLKNNNFTSKEINQIRIKLQLKGIDLNKKVY